jgi:hypothetical protein
MGGPHETTVARCIRESGSEDSFVEVMYVDDTPPPPPTQEETRRGYVTFSRHWMDLVFPNSVPKAEETTDTLKVLAGRGEYEAVSFCLRTLRKLHGIEVKAGALVSNKGDRLAAPEVRIVRCVPRRFPEWKPLYESGPLGVMNMPTYLESPRPVDVEAERTLQYWLTVHVGSDARAGTYDGDVEITQQAGEAQTLRITVEVLPIDLDEPTIALGFWDFDTYNGQLGSVADVYMTMRRYGMNAVSINNADLSLWDADNNRFDYSDFLTLEQDGRIRVTMAGSPLEERMEAAKNAGFHTVIYNPRWGYRGGFIAEAILQSVDHQTLERESAQELERIAAPYERSDHHERIASETRAAAEKYFPAFSDSFAKAYVLVLNDILEESRRRGWPRMLVDPTDERISHYRRGDTMCLALAVRDLELMKRAGATTILNLIFPTLKSPYRDYARELLRFTDVAMPPPRLSEVAVGAYGERGPMNEVIADFSKMGIKTYNYNLTIYGMPDLGAARFNSGYYFETIGAGVEGEFDYVYFRPEGDPYNPIDGHEFMWFFPPHKPSKRLGGPSLWLEAKRQGVDDLRYIQTLKRLIQEAGENRAGREAKATLARILESFDFRSLLQSPNWAFPRGRWDLEVAKPGVAPTVQGSCRPPAGWAYKDFDLNRRVIVEAIASLQRTPSD